LGSPSAPAGPSTIEGAAKTVLVERSPSFVGGVAFFELPRDLGPFLEDRVHALQDVPANRTVREVHVLRADLGPAGLRHRIDLGHVVLRRVDATHGDPLLALLRLVALRILRARCKRHARRARRHRQPSVPHPSLRSAALPRCCADQPARHPARRAERSLCLGRMQVR
jgi:hypothetical protein